MTTLTTHVHVKADRQTTFDHLVAFEAYPEFVKFIHRAGRSQEHEQRVEFAWVLAGTERVHRVDVTLDQPATTVYWQSVDGPHYAGSAVVEQIAPERSALAIKVELEPSGVLGRMGSATGVVRARIEHHLHQFSAYVEEQTGRRPTRGNEGVRAPSERLFDAVFPSDETTRGR